MERFALIALTLLTGCPSSEPPPCAYGHVEASIDAPLLRTGVPGTLSLDVGGTAAHGSLQDTPASCLLDITSVTLTRNGRELAAPELPATVELRPSVPLVLSAELVADEPGTYVVEIFTSLESQRVEFTAVTDTPDLTRGLVRLNAECTDVELMDDLVLCVRNGVTALNRESLEPVWASPDHVPISYGIAAAGRGFATATIGCGGPSEGICDDGATRPAGVRLFEVLQDQTVELRALIPLAFADEVALEGDRLWITSPRGLEVYDVSDPTRPERVGCGALDGFGLPQLGGVLFGLPLVDEERVIVLGASRIALFDRESLESGCDDQTPVEPVVVLDDQPRMFNRGGPDTHFGPPATVRIGELLVVGYATGVATYRIVAREIVLLDRYDGVSLSGIAGRTEGVLALSGSKILLFGVNADGTITLDGAADFDGSPRRLIGDTRGSYLSW